MENHIDKIAAIHRSSALRIIALVKSFEELLEAIDQETALALQAHEGMKKLYLDAGYRQRDCVGSDRVYGGFQALYAPK
jgi:hypothetical protein